MRFLSGRYVGADGVERQGSFGFFWLDLFAGPVDPQGPPGQPGQLHEFNRGPPARGRPFWAVRPPIGAGSVDPAASTASFRVAGLRTADYLLLANALVGGPSAPSTVSFDLRWGGPTRRASRVDRDHRFAIDGTETGCTMTWTAHREDSGFTFTSDPSTSRPGYAAVYRERNGVFFPG